jgi:hypothetical protein
MLPPDIDPPNPEDPTEAHSRIDQQSWEGVKGKLPTQRYPWLGMLGSEIEKAKDDKALQKHITTLDKRIPLRQTAASSASFLAPPTVKPRPHWHSLLTKYPIDHETALKLFDAGVVLADRAFVLDLLGKKLPPSGSLSGQDFYLDLDYGLLLYMDNQGLRSLSIQSDKLTAAAIMKLIPNLLQDHSLYYELGAFRGQRFAPKKASQDGVPEFNISTKRDLNTIVDRLRAKLRSSPNFELWFRGQPGDYLLPDLQQEANNDICPWRVVRDTSLVPSLFRTLSRQLSDMRAYARTCFDLTQYALYVEDILNARPYNQRKPGEPPTEYFEEGDWAGRDELAMTVEISDESGNILDIHDYNPTARGIQKSLFLQHYGLPSSILDITHDLDVALFFAQNRIVDGKYVPVDFTAQHPVIYLLILDRKTDPLVPSYVVAENYGLLRPARQKCGMLKGATLTTRNDYARYIAIKLHLRARIEGEDYTPDYMFPSAGEDTFLSDLLRFADAAGMQTMRPFTLAASG